MLHIQHRSALFLLSLVLLLSLLSLPATAITPSYEVSAVYRRSTYYQNLLVLPTTGDGAFDTLSAALSQYGYHEGSATSDFDGENTSGSGNYTEYNFALGKVGGSYGYAWCAAFASWCLQQAGQADSAGGLFASCTLWVERLQALGRYQKRTSGYTPRAGDLIFFRSSGTGRASDHVGLVRYVTGGRVYTVEGNSSGRVSLRNYALGDSYIAGYGRPAYSGVEKGISRLRAEDSAAGFYVVTYDFLNIRAARSAGSAKQGTLKEGEVFCVLETRDGWGSIDWQGKRVYVSLDYADFVAPLEYRVRYVSEGKTLLDKLSYSTDAVGVAAFTPEREGYRFLHWSGSDGAIYETAQTLPAADLTLTAVWEILPVVELPPDAGGDMGEDTDTEVVLPPPESEEVTGPTFSEGGEDPPLQGEEMVEPDNLAAARHAGVVSGLLALSCGALWMLLRRKEE